MLGFYGQLKMLFCFGWPTFPFYVWRKTQQVLLNPSSKNLFNITGGLWTHIEIRLSSVGQYLRELIRWTWMWTWRRRKDWFVSFQLNLRSIVLEDSRHDVFGPWIYSKGDFLFFIFFHLKNINTQLIYHFILLILRSF